MAEESGRAVIGGEGDCTHGGDRLAYLGQMGTAAFYRCAGCDGVVVAWPRARSEPRERTRSAQE